MFDGTMSNPHGKAGKVLIDEKERKLTFMLRLVFPCSNNEAENMRPLSLG